MNHTITDERREQLVNAVWGGVMIAFTVVVTVLAVAVVLATIVGFVVIGKWIGSVT